MWKKYDAGTSIAASAKAGLSNAVEKISEYISDGIDAEPTIRPILDLSRVQAGAGKLSALLSRTQAMQISSDIANQAVSTIQNGESVPVSGNSYNFTQNNYSPKSLSRVEIYRQTKNQFSAMERMVEA